MKLDFLKSCPCGQLTRYRSRRCPACAKRKATDAYNRRHAQRKALGVCQDCDDPAEPGRARCAGCLEYRRSERSRPKPPESDAGLVCEIGYRPQKFVTVWDGSKSVLAEVVWP